MFETVRNFRDCGGYPTNDGRRMRTGLLYRSAHFPDAGDDDLDAIKALHITTIVDLRRPAERAKHPTRRWPGFAAEIVEHDGYTLEELPPHLVAFAEAGSSAAAADAAMTEIYRALPFDPMMVALYRSLFDALADSEGAVLVHCAAGKDRTGLAVALVQHVAGVSESDIMDHYLATNRSNLVNDEIMQNIRENLSREGRPVCDEAILTVLAVTPEYLDTAFAAIRARHDTIDAYLTDVIGLSSARRTAIVARLSA